MEEKIVETLREVPGLRLREIAMYLRCNRFGLLNPIDKLLKAGRITTVTVENFVQGEFYAKYYLVEDAPSVKVIHTTENLDY